MEMAGQLKYSFVPKAYTTLLNLQKASERNRIGMKLYAVVLILLVILTLSAICEAGRGNEKPKIMNKITGLFKTNSLKKDAASSIVHQPKHDDTTSYVQEPYSNPSYTHDDTTSYVQEPYSNPSYTHDYTTSYVQEPYSNPSYTHDYTTSYVQEPYSNPSYTHDDTTSYVQEPYSNPSYTHDDTTSYVQAPYSYPSDTGAMVNAQQNVAAQDAHLGQQHNADGTRPLHVDDYFPWG